MKRESRITEKTNMNDYLNKLIEKQNLSEREAEQLANLITEPDTDSVLISAILTALKIKGESIDEIVGFIKAMRKKMIFVKNGQDAIDIVGTGGDGSNSFNISTASALVVAGTGIKVAKHGNRATSSKCGSADVLEALGVNINLSSKKAESVLKNSGMVFMFAPMFHPAMKVVGPIRKRLKIRTIFNYLGPFLNPANVSSMLLGTANLILAQKFLEIAKKLNFKHLIIVSSNDGLDEISIADKTTAFELKNEKVKKFIIYPQKLGFKKYKKEELTGGDPKTNAEIIKEILNGKGGAKLDAVILNSAYALIISGKAKTLKEGLKLATESIDSGGALQILKKLIKETNL